ncbi:MAG: Uma2 family endonuclease [Nitrospirota bacterium]
MFKKTVQHGRSERRGEAYSSRYVEPLSDLRTKLADFFNILPVIEIVSDSTRKVDEITKRKSDEHFGVQEYWVVDPVLETVKVYRMTDKGYARAAELTNESKDCLTTPLLPGLQLSLAEIFG